MIYLNILYFAIITYYGYRFLFNGGEVRSPFNRDERLRLDGPEMFWCLTFATGLLAFSANVGLDLMAIRLFVLEAFCVVGLGVVRHKAIWSAPLVLYVAYLVWIVIGCLYGPSLVYGFRVVLKYLYPLLLCLFASAAVRYVEVGVKASLLARMVAFISLFFSFIPLIEGLLARGVFWYGTARAINYISIMILSLALFHYSDEKKKNLFYAVLFLIPCFLWVFRTSIMGSLVAIMAFYFIRYRLRSLPIIFGIIVLGVVAVFTIPSLREKMFYDKNITLETFREGKVSSDQVNTNARAAMWEMLEKRFYNEHELTGSGTGSVQNYMYNHVVFGGLKVPHSDLTQMKCDNGLIGVVLYGLVILLIFGHAFLTYWGTRDNALRLMAIVAGASVMGVFVTLYSDNVVNYSMATLSMPFGFYGMMLGLKRGPEFS